MVPGKGGDSALTHTVETVLGRAGMQSHLHRMEQGPRLWLRADDLAQVGGLRRRRDRFDDDVGFELHLAAIAVCQMQKTGGEAEREEL